jgi:acyl-CoA reductase-like NAD-dependent aldehyde dehydrogenase
VTSAVPPADGATFDRHDPADARGSSASPPSRPPADVADAVAAAADAAAAWADHPAPKRAEILTKAGQALAAKASRSPPR